MENLGDIFAILTDKEKLDAVLQIGLDKEYLEYKFNFAYLKGNVKRGDLTTSTTLIH
jgi:hypothetical protein